MVGDVCCDDVTNSFDSNYNDGNWCESFVNNQYCTECQCIGGSGIGIMSRKNETTILFTKGQYISEPNFLVHIWTKKGTKLFFDFCPSL